jgi:hypothetical protein
VLNYTRLERVAGGKHSSLLCLFVKYEEDTKKIPIKALLIDNLFIALINATLLVCFLFTFISKVIYK